MILRESKELVYCFHEMYRLLAQWLPFVNCWKAVTFGHRPGCSSRLGAWALHLSTVVTAVGRLSSPGSGGLASAEPLSLLQHDTVTPHSSLSACPSEQTEAGSQPPAQGSLLSVLSCQGAQCWGRKLHSHHGQGRWGRREKLYSV